MSECDEGWIHLTYKELHKYIDMKDAIQGKVKWRWNYCFSAAEEHKNAFAHLIVYGLLEELLDKYGSRAVANSKANKVQSCKNTAMGASLSFIMWKENQK